MMSEQTIENQTVDTPDVEVVETEKVRAAPEAIEAEGEEGNDNGAPADDVDGELKTVRKALDKRNRYINNQRNKIRALETEILKMKEGFNGGNSEAPKLETFDSVIDYMDAKNNHTLDQKLAEQAHKAQLAALEQQQQMAFNQQAQEVHAQVQELLASSPEFSKVISANANVIQAMPPHVEKLMAEIDNAPAATYALAKEGRLQDLYYMPEHIAAAHLVQAEIRGQQYLQQSTKPTQQAPKPIGKLGGSGKSTGKSVDDMSADELMKWLKN